MRPGASGEECSREKEEQCKDPEAGMWLPSWKTSQEAGVARVG